MFVDLIEIEVKAGKGGDGLVSFRREKFIDRGGPNGGDGGHGGDVVFVADNQEPSLAKFHHQKLIRAEDGQAGGSSNKRGRSADDVTVSVPIGTCITDLDTGNLLADFKESGERLVVADGGEGGFGNAHFKSSRRQTPLLAEKGLPGAHKHLKCELKLVADVGIVGLPNAGKSTFLSVVSNAHPAIADYPFTTLTPNLGVADVANHSLLLADIPGLIEGAASGKGLGYQFLRHAERSKALLHLIDAYSPDPAGCYQTIRHELSDYSQILTKLPEVVAITKTEAMTAGRVNKVLNQLEAVVSAETVLLAISSQAHLNLPAVLRALKGAVKSYQPPAPAEKTGLPVFGLSPAQKAANWQVQATDNHYLVLGDKIEKFAHKTHFDTYHSISRLRAIMYKLGITHELIRRGYDGGQVIIFGQPEIGRLQAEDEGSER